MKKATLIPGDGIGPEVIEAAVDCVRASGAEIEWELQEMRNGFLGEEVVESIKKNRVALKGPITTPIGKGYRSLNVQLRNELELFAGVRPVKLLPGIKSHYEKVDIVIFRENTEDLYAGIEFRKGSKAQKQLLAFLKKHSYNVPEDSGISLKPNSVKASKRIAEFAFHYAEKNGRKKITAGHKANILKDSDGLFLETARRVAGYHKHMKIAFNDMIMDHLCMQLVRKPEEFDVLLLPNLYGDIVSDLCAGLVGGLGMVGGANIGTKHAVFETVHGTAPKHAGKNDANPAGAILSACMMLDYIGMKPKAARIRNALGKVIKEGKTLTYDIAGRKPSTTTQMAQAIIKKIEGG